jgi:Tol biopolymer transport system component
MVRLPLLLAALSAALTLAAPALAADSYQPGTTLLVGRSSGLGALPAQSDGGSWSEGRAVSADGRFSVFRSGANDLGVADTLTHAFVRDDQTGVVTLLDQAGAGGPVGDAGATQVSISGDGSHACFSSYADNLVAGVGAEHVYLVTLATHAVVAVDRASGGAIANHRSYGCSLDAAGDTVAFQSEATNLGGGGGHRHVYVRYPQTGSTQLVDSYQAIPGDGDAGGAAIDGAGDAVAFWTSATNLLAGGDQNGRTDVYWRYLPATTPTLVSRANGGGAIGNANSGAPSISADGWRVAFESNASNLGDGDGDTNEDVHVRDLFSATTALVSRADGASGVKANQASYSPEMAGDGSAVAFTSHATNLGADPGPGEEGTGELGYVRSLSGNTTTVVTRASGAGALALGESGQVSLDQHAKKAIFDTGAHGLDPLASGSFSEVFERALDGDLQTRLISRPADASSRPAQYGPVDSEPHAISADGRFVVFTTSSPFGAAGGTGEVYLRDVLQGTTQLVSRADGADGAPANASSWEAAISADGTKVAFASQATNLAGGVDGQNGQIYVRDLAANTTRLVSTGPAGPGDLYSGDPVLSQDGSRVAFWSAATNLVLGDANGKEDVFVRDLAAGTTVRASLTVAGSEANADATGAEISADGSRIAWMTYAANIGAGASTGQHGYVRDLVAGTTTLFDRAADGSVADPGISGFSMSADANRIAFDSHAKLTPGATNTQGDAYVRDLAAGTTTLASLAPDGTEPTTFVGSPTISPDGTKVAFWTRSPNFPAPADHGAQWVRDLAHGTTTLLSARDGSQEPADDGGWAPSLDADGGCSVFASKDATLASPSYAGDDYAQLWLRVLGGECPVHAPDTTLTSGPDGSAKVRTAASAFAYTADESNATFVCSLDGAPVKPCGGTFVTGALADGVHRFSVAAVDRAGNTDPTPALATFTVGVPPQLSKLRVKHGRLLFTLSEQAAVRAVLTPRHGLKLTLKRSFKGGARRIKLPRKRLRKGRYVVTVTATDAGGNRSLPKRTRFVAR